MKRSYYKRLGRNAYSPDADWNEQCPWQDENYADIRNLFHDMTKRCEKLAQIIRLLLPPPHSDHNSDPIVAKAHAVLKEDN